jgi:hypothetical protein
MKSANDAKMLGTYKRYVRDCHNMSDTKSEFLQHIKAFENSRLVLDTVHAHELYFADLKAHYLQRSFGKELAHRFRSYCKQSSIEVLEKLVASSACS